MHYKELSAPRSFDFLSAHSSRQELKDGSMLTFTHYSSLTFREFEHGGQHAQNFCLIVAFLIVITFWEQLGGALSQVIGNLIAPLRELFGPDASTAGRLYGFGLAALAASVIIY